MHLFFCAVGENIEKPLDLVRKRLMSVYPMPEPDWHWETIRPVGFPITLISLHHRTAVGIFDHRDTSDHFHFAYGRTVKGQSPIPGCTDYRLREPFDVAPPNLHGCYVVMTLNKRDNSLAVFTDPGGRRTLLYREINGTLCMSSHELPLALFPGGTPEIDPVSAISVLGGGWSVGAGPLISGCLPVTPQRPFLYREGRIQRPFFPRLYLEPRIAEGDRASISRGLDAIGESFRSTVRTLAGGGAVDAALTAGLDSRVMLAAMRAEGISPDLYTAGAPNSQEVRVAAQIAGKTGLPHHTVNIELPERNEFTGNLAYLALFFNGQTSGARALGPGIVARGERAFFHGGHGDRPYFGGTGSGIIRGYYCPADWKGLDPEKAGTTLAHTWRSVEPLVDPGHLKALRGRVVEVFSDFAKITPVPADWFDLFYYYERFRCWAILTVRSETAGIYREPYAHHDLLETVRRLPAPVGSTALDFYRRMILNHLPGVANTLINGKKHIRLYGRKDRYSVFLAGIVERIGSAERALNKLLHPRKKVKSVDHLRRDMLLGPLSDSVRSITMHPESLGRTIFTESGQHPVPVFLERKGNYKTLEVVSYLLTLEQFNKMMLEGLKVD